MKRLLSRRAFPGVALALLGAVVLSAWMQQNPRTLYERARLLDEGNQNLAEAIRLYGQVADLAKDQPALAASALVQMGRCQERMGQAEARKAYQRVIDEYPQQVEQVKLARERLAALTQQAGDAGKPRFRRIQAPTKLPESGRLSPDGQQLAFVSEGSLWVVPVHGNTDPDIFGMPVRLTKPKGAWDSSNVSITWSVDGKWIGFLNAIGQGETIDGHELNIIPAGGGQPQRTPISWKKRAGDVDTLLYALSADAQTIYFADGKPAEELRIYSMPVRGGERQALTEPTTREPSLSPDGTRIAYVKARPGGKVAATNQVWTRLVGGGEPVLLCELPDPKWVRSPVWSPDGRMIAFLASEKGNVHKQVWVVSMDGNARPVATPSKFDLPGTTDLSISGWTQDNKIGILIPSPSAMPLYTVPSEGGKATQLTTRDAAMPRWSHDGKRIYFAGEAENWGMGIEYVPADGGKAVKVPISGTMLAVYPSQIAISPDGKMLCFASRTQAVPDTHLYTVPVEGGIAVLLPVGAAPTADFVPEWSPDGNQISFVRYEEVKPGLKGFNIFTIPPNGGEPRRISSADDQVHYGSLAWSPDGAMIAYFGQDRTLRLIPTGGGRSHILVSDVGYDPQCGITWSPDGKRIAYSTRNGLWIVSRDGGKSEKIATGLDAELLKIGWSPDGKRIAFTANKGADPELWLMEDFLPLVKTGK